MVKIHELTGFKRLKSKNGRNVRYNATYLCLSVTNYESDKEMLLFLSEIHHVHIVDNLLPIIEKHVKGNQIKKLHIGIYQDDEDETLEGMTLIVSNIVSNEIKTIKGLIKRELTKQNRLN